jgi:hypothetical protein
MIAYIRKLDILNRVFILKYGKFDDLVILERPVILKLPNLSSDKYSDINSNSVNDIMLLNVITKNRLYYLASEILIDLIVITKEISLSSKILLKLQNYYGRNIFKNRVLNISIESNSSYWLFDSLIKHDVKQIIFHMIESLSEEMNKASIFYRNRKLNPEIKIDQSLISNLIDNDILNLFISKLKLKFPLFTVD